MLCPRLHLVPKINGLSYVSTPAYPFGLCRENSLNIYVFLDSAKFITVRHNSTAF
jgi:hypothetical protein